MLYSEVSGAQRVKGNQVWKSGVSLITDFVLDTYGQKGYKIWEGQALRHREKTHDEGTKVTLMFLEIRNL